MAKTTDSNAATTADPSETPGTPIDVTKIEASDINATTTTDPNEAPETPIDVTKVEASDINATTITATSQKAPLNPVGEFIVAGQVRHDGETYEAGDPIIIDETTFNELKAVGAVLGSWD